MPARPAADPEAAPRRGALVVMGVAGCGKSTLAEALASELGLQAVEGDAYHPPENVRKMRAGRPLDDADRAGWLDTLAGVLATQDGIVLSCSALKRAYRDRLRAASWGLRFVHLALTPAAAEARARARPGHFFHPALVASQFEALEVPDGEPGVLTLDATEPIGQLLQRVRDWWPHAGLNNVRNEEPAMPPAAPAPQPRVDPEPASTPASPLQRMAGWAMAACLGVMAVAVFVNAVLRYTVGGGIAASEELSRLLFVWMVFIGATAAYPAGEHMAFTSLVAKWRDRPALLRGVTLLLRLLVILACVLLAIGAWAQVRAGMDSRSTVLNYPVALLPLPALLCSVAIAAMALFELLRGAPLHLGHEAEFE